MAHQISMVKINDIITLCKHGISQREVARKLSVHRQTVSRYVRLAREGSKSTIPPAGSAGEEPSKSAISPPGTSGRKSQCQPFSEVIQVKLERGLTAQRIYQDLADGAGVCWQL